nr:PREDICTED: endoribonuclease Dicer [Bemisia tabaci]XP_018899829.1 PREDICTED: endoribonuclease Dicer [Bemisia tabaci]XP_018899830.1 PREDICTED: endoribonuclease Dicer [Bemisia tabaci]
MTMEGAASGFTPREYQTLIMEKAMKENIIIYLPTGAGKTYIASLLIKRMCGAIKKPFSEGGKRSFFLVNTVQLVEQQAQAVRQAIPLRVGEYSGDKGVDGWTVDQWNQQFDQHEILVMTAQIFQDLLSSNTMKLENVNLLIFDECHRAVQNHPMRQIMEQFEGLPVEKQPRVLGLTATLLNGSCKPENVDEEITHLERTLQSKIVSFIDDDQVLRFSTNPTEHLLCYDDIERSDLSKYCDERIRKLSDKISHIQFELFMQNVEAPVDYSLLTNKEDKPKKCLKNMLADLSHVLNDMNVFGLYVGALAQIVRLERMKLSTCDGFLYNIFNVVVTELIFIRKIISDHIDESDYACVLKYLSPKVLLVLDLVKDSDKNSTLIFVERRFTAKVLYSLIKDFIVESNSNLFKNVRIDFVIGNTNPNILATNDEAVFARKINSDIIDKFYQKKLNVLIATDVLEEGTDIPLCNAVMKYDIPVTFRSYVQSKGRARSKESNFYILVPKWDQERFCIRYRVFQNIEKKLKEILIRDRVKPSEEEIDEDLYQDRELPPFCPLGPGGPRVTMVAAPSLVNRYVQSLPHDKFSTILPLYFVKHEVETDEYTVKIQLPSNSPIKTLIQGQPMKCSKSAKQAAALEACKVLYEAKELNQNLLPRGSSSIYLEDPKWFPHWEDEKFEKGDPEPGTTKKIRMHEKKYSTTLEDCQPDIGSSVFLHVFDIKPKFELSIEESKQRRMYYFSLLKKKNTFGILTNKPIPQICDFPLFMKFGELEVKMRMNIPIEALNKSQLKRLHKFHCLLFMQVLDVVKSFMMSNATERASVNSSYMVCPVYPTDENDPSSYIIDWAAVDSYQKKFSEVNEVSDRIRKGMSFNYESLEGSLIVPWYRGYNISKQSYIVTRIAKELNPLSQFPSVEYQTYSDYFKNKYSKTIYHDDQYLVDVYPVNSKLNCIVPRLRTSKRKIDTDREHMDETLVPELCVQIKFPTVYWIKAIFLPSALHRLNRLMISEELRLRIVLEAQMGAEFYPLDKIAPLTVDIISVENLPLVEAPTSPVSTVTNSFERSVMEWKTAKRSNEFPWLDHEIPADIDRNLKKISIVDLKNYDNFFANSPSIVKSRLPVESYQNSKVTCGLSTWRPSSVTPFRLSILETSSCKLGPQQCEIFQCITSLQAHDIQNYEYLETLGDSYLKFAVSLSLFLYCGGIDEGKLTRLKGKLLGNRNLFYCANVLELASLLEVYSFSPNDDWLPPRFGVENTVREVMREAELPPEGLFQINFTEEEKITGVISEEKDVEVEKKLVELASAAANEEEPRGRSPCSILYLNRQEVQDKNVADCVEALLGVYVKKCGIQAAFRMLLYFGILPDSIIRQDLVFDDTFVPDVSMNPAADTPQQVEFLLQESCYEVLERQIGYTFKDKRYILQALSHTSFTQNVITECYQRLEFLGDAILDFLITCYIFEKGQHLTPGQVTDVRSACVNNVTFACLAVRYSMHKSLLCRSVTLLKEIDKFAKYQEGKNHRIGEEVLILLAEDDLKIAEAIDVPKALGDIFESIAGAIYLDSGKDLKTVWRVYYNLMHRELEEFCNKPPKNVVRKLHELNIDAKFLPTEPVPDVADIVMVPLEARINNEMKKVFGFGRNKSAAKKAAAKMITNIVIANSNA